MAEADDDDRNIPVFTVSKNNAIIKNIFLLHAPPDMRNRDDEGLVVVDQTRLQEEQILTVGRHPSCSIVLSHPSISRFHLQIRSEPDSRELSVTDLSSVHGTWVSGKRIRPRDCVELNEGDELRLGGSSRVYKLHWVSACQAYDLDNPFCPSSDVVMCDDIQKREEESLFQDESGLLAKDDVSLDLDAKTSFVSCEEVPIQRPVRNDSVLKGILKHKKESSPCMVKPLSFPLPYGQMMQASNVGEIYVENQFKNAPLFSDIPSGRKIECCQMAECDDSVSLSRNLSEDHEQTKLFCPLPESCMESSKVKAEECSQQLEVFINAGLLASQESPTAMSEEQSPPAEDQSKMCVDTANGSSGINEEETSLREMEKGINLSVIASQTSNLDLTVELFSTENKERFDSVIMDTCEYSDVKNEAPMLDLTGELFTTENGEGSDPILTDACDYSDVKNEAPKSAPINFEPTILPVNSDETQHSKIDRVSTEFVSVQGSVHHDSVVKPEDIIQISEIESGSPQLTVSSAVRLGLKDSNIDFESGNGMLVSDSCIQILEPLLDSFVFTENDTKESCGLMSVKSESEGQSPKTPLGAKSIQDGGNEKGSKSVSNRKSNMSKVSSLRCQPLGALKILSCSSIVKRRGSTATARTQLRNSDTVSKNQFDHEEGKNEICTPEKENRTYNVQPLNCIKKMSILDDFEFSSSNSKSYSSYAQNISSNRSQKAASMALMGDLENEEYEAEMYTPDKENFTPNTRLMKSMKRMGLLDENKMSSSVSEKARSLKVFNSPFLSEQNYRSGSEKENDSLFNGQELARATVRNQAGNKKTYASVQSKAERVPLQSLSINSSCRSKPVASFNKVATRSEGSVTRAHFQRNISPINNKIKLEPKVKWCMIVDSTCFLDNKSRKALTLLQGLRGTKLIVPGTVLRELDARKQQASFFRRTTEVSAALKWLEDCLVNTKWWIHIQSSFEEARHLLPTPPASPKLFDSTHHNGKKCWKTLSIFQNLLEVSSPKTEDHILEYALQQMRNTEEIQQIAILSNDTSLRIKATAQGLLCETATEFRDSLVNPFSERFHWSQSSPRGRTWSCHDDFVLKEHFYSHHSGNPSKEQETVKGLKLIIAYDSTDNKTASNLQWK